MRAVRTDPVCKSNTIDEFLGKYVLSNIVGYKKGHFLVILEPNLKLI